ncbi:MAG: winged helix-turn-helix domain-containing protein [Granulosicoccaceae bacterium]
MDSITVAQARKLILLSQRLPGNKHQPTNATLAHLQHLSYVQIDTISVVERAHHHVLWSRNPKYKPQHIDKLVAAGEVFEYWSHAAAYLPMCDFRHSLPRKEAIARGELEHWYPRDDKQIREVLARIRAEGPLKARDFEHDNSLKKPGEWHHKPAKRALTYLFMQGDLMCCRREGFQMVYDLRDRVLPAGVDTRLPSDNEHARHLIGRYLRAQGLGEIKDVAYLRKGIKASLLSAAEQMLEAGELMEVAVNNKPYLALHQQLALLDKRLPMSRACLLSPFDNLVIQRHRMRELFGFDYQIECYVPQAKRQYGYFCLPILWRGRLCARLDCKVNRADKTLKIHSLHVEEHLKKTEEFATALGAALLEFCQFNACAQVDWSTLKDKPASTALAAELARIF